MRNPSHPTLEPIPCYGIYLAILIDAGAFWVCIPWGYYQILENTPS